MTTNTYKTCPDCGGDLDYERFEDVRDPCSGCEFYYGMEIRDDESTRHTPGPWEYDWTTKTNCVIEGWAFGPADKPLDEVDHIDPVGLLDNDRENQEANARLLAAAPELLAALTDALGMLDHYMSGRADNWDGSTKGQARSTLADGRAAIAKATAGEES